MCAIIVFYVYFVLYIELLFGDVGLNGSLGTSDFIPNGSNLNYYTSGVYMIGDANKLENSPDASWSILIAFGSNSIYSVQIVISVLDSKNSIYVRTKLKQMHGVLGLKNKQKIQIKVFSTQTIQLPMHSCVF